MICPGPLASGPGLSMCGDVRQGRDDGHPGLRWWWGVCNVWRAVGGCLEWFEWFWVVAGSAGWLSGLWFCGFGVGVVGLVGSPCDGFCMVVCGDCCVGVMFENSTVCL